MARDAPPADGVGAVPGQLVGHYRIVRKLGRGGMGIVYLATDTKLGRKVALKCIPPDRVTDPSVRRRFLRESRTASTLDHPHIVTIYETLEHEGCPWIAMALVEGKPLYQVLKEQGPLPLRDTLRHAETLISALRLAHANRILHRDINPNNILIAADGRALLADFGLARHFVPQGDESNATTETTVLTRPGRCVGTPGYMSPEQLAGGRLDHRSDIYSLGAVLFEMCTGQKAGEGFSEGDVSGAVARATGSMAGREIPRHLEHIVRRMLAPNPSDRYQDTDSLLAEVRELRKKLDVLVYDDQHPWTAPWLSWHRAVRVLGVVAVLALLLSWGGSELLRWLRAPILPLPKTTARQVTTAEGWEDQPAISPDGKFIAFVAQTRGNTDIWLVTSDGAPPMRLTTDPSVDFHPAWFPDGRSLAYESIRGGRPGIWKISVLGGSPTPLIDNAMEGSIAPDGERMAFTRAEADGSFPRVFVADLRPDATPRQLSHAEDGLWAHQHPSWSPDGREVVYASFDNLWIADAFGAVAPRKVIPQNGPDLHPVWSPDGKHIYFSSYREDTCALWRVHPDGTALERVTSGVGPESWPQMSGDGHLLTYTTYIANPDILIRNLATGQTSRLPGVSTESDPALAPDGSALAFVSDRWGGKNDLWVVDLVDGAPRSAAPRRLTDHPGAVSHPSFSADGRLITYYRVFGGSRDVWVLGLDGAPPMPFTQDPASDYHPAFSPDGRRIAFVSDRSGTAEVWVGAFESGKPASSLRQITHAAQQITQDPIWSPDGRELAYVCSFNDSAEACITPVDGGGSDRRVTEGAQADRIQWDPASGLLYVSGLWDGRTTTLRRVDPVTGASTPLDPPVDFGTQDSWGSFSLSRDGKILAYHREDRQGDIWVLEAIEGRF